jgi:hypothetical protein
MKSGKIGLGAAALAVAIGLSPSIGWSSRPFGAMITGEVTSAPLNGEIEIAHHLYHVKAKSAADKALTSFYAGQNVDVVLDGPANSSGSQIVSIVVHSGS